MARIDPALKDRESAGILGMLVWGASSSVAVILAPMIQGGLLFTYDVGIAMIIVFSVLIALTIAAVVWGIGGLLVALPVWAVLVASGMSGRRLVLLMVTLGALVVGGIWAGFVRQPLGSPGYLLAFGMGAVSGALGGYGFCRSAMRS